MKLNNTMKARLRSLDQRLPFAKSVIRGSSVVQTLLSRTGLLPMAVLDRVGEDFLSIRPLRDLPDLVKFRVDQVGLEPTLLFGASHYFPVLSNMDTEIIVRDDRDSEITRVSRLPLHDRPMDPPRIIKERLPNIAVWYARSVGNLPENAESIMVRFHYRSSLQQEPLLPAGFRFYCVAAFCVNAPGGHEQWVVDMTAGVPVWARVTGE